MADTALRREGVIDVRIEATAKQGRRAFADHAADWKAHLTAKGNTAKHVLHMTGALERLNAKAKAETLADLTPARVQAAVGELRDEGASLRTCNHYLTAVKGFSRWAHRDGRLSADPLAGLSGFNVATDRKRQRRPLTADEAAYLLAQVECGPTWRGVPGVDVAMVYRLALGTGFRAAELRSLTRASFDLASDPPAVTVQAAYSKRRRDDRQPIRADLADRLRAYLADRDVDGPVLNVPERTGEMLRADLRRARARWIRETADGAERRTRRLSGFLAPVDAEGRVVDFHALRATYITLLVKGGATVRVAQELARHSDPKLTMNTYTKLGIHDLTGALDGLLGENAEGGPVIETVAATGTDDARGDDARSNRRSNRGADDRDRVRQGATKSALRMAGGDDENAGKTGGKCVSVRPDAAASGNAPRRTRTFNPLIKSQLLCQLS